MSVGTTAALAITAGIGAAGSLGSAYIGSRAAGNAARQQAAAGDRAAQLFDDFDPSRVATANQFFIDHLSNSRDWSRERNQDERVRAMTQLDPYTGAGTFGLGMLRDEIGPGGRLATQFTADNFRELDPGFDFRISEGQNALARSQFARGQGLSGAAARELARYSQDYASSEFNNAFNRFQSGNQQRYEQLVGLSGLGLRAADMDIASGNAYADRFMRNNAMFDLPIAQQNLDTSQYLTNLDFSRRATIGDFLTGSANARAAGTVGSANAWSGGLGGATNGISNAILLSTLIGGGGSSPIYGGGRVGDFGIPTPPPMPALGPAPPVSIPMFEPGSAPPESSQATMTPDGTVKLSALRKMPMQQFAYAG